jgi:hypothetical protein
LPPAFWSCPNLKSIPYCASIAIVMPPRIHSETVFWLALAGRRFAKKLREGFQ